MAVTENRIKWSIKQRLDTTSCCVYNEIMHKIFYYLNLYKGLIPGV